MVKLTIKGNYYSTDNFGDVDLCVDLTLLNIIAVYSYLYL